MNLRWLSISDCPPTAQPWLDHIWRIGFPSMRKTLINRSSAESHQGWSKSQRSISATDLQDRPKPVGCGVVDSIAVGLLVAPVS